MKILFTSVGRRVELIQAFRNASQELNENVTLIGVDIKTDAPALFFCDRIRRICDINNEQYIPQLLLLCKEEKVDCLIPTIDTDLLLLAENKNRFERIGTKVLVSAVDKVKVCRDKNFTAGYFASLGLLAPETVNSIEKYEERALGFPAFIKPKDGSSSIDAYKAENIFDLKVYADKIKDYVIQPYISGKEYTIDILCDYYGSPIFITPRERIAVRAGEVSKTRIIYDETIISEMQTLIMNYKPCGQITVQLIRENISGDDYYIEINPRFGGGAPLSMKAGADSAKAIIRMLKGEVLKYEDRAARNGAIFSRFDQSICIN
ncbi:ATP-grasp domain-containing protein [Blautia schinkii]|nr:ATP-grasp domain-containing protein [Blautia schinkii]